MKYSVMMKPVTFLLSTVLCVCVCEKLNDQNTVTWLHNHIYLPAFFSRSTVPDITMQWNLLIKAPPRKGQPNLLIKDILLDI